MTPNPKISILVTVYNQRAYLERAIGSILAQDYQNLEIIIGDDCSQDGDLSKMIHDFNDPRIKLVRNPRNLGRRQNYRHLLFDLATGDLATIFNADDYFGWTGYLTKVVKLFSSDEKIALVYGLTMIDVEATGEKIGDAIIDDLPTIMDGNWLFLNQPKGYVIPHITSVYKRKLAIELDFYRADIISEDWESLLRMILSRKVGFVKEVSGFYGRHKNNVSKVISFEALINNALYIISPYETAIELGQIPKMELDIWKEKMLFRYFVKCYIKVSLWKTKDVKPFLLALSLHHPAISKKIKNDWRVAIFNLIKHNHTLLRFAFSKYSKQESVIADFIQYAKNTKED